MMTSIALLLCFVKDSNHLYEFAFEITNFMLNDVHRHGMLLIRCCTLLHFINLVTALGMGWTW